MQPEQYVPWDLFRCSSSREDDSLVGVDHLPQPPQLAGTRVRAFVFDFFFVGQPCVVVFLVLQLLYRINCFFPRTSSWSLRTAGG